MPDPIDVRVPMRAWVTDRGNAHELGARFTYRKAQPYVVTMEVDTFRPRAIQMSLDLLTSGLDGASTGDTTRVMPSPDGDWLNITVLEDDGWFHVTVPAQAVLDLEGLCRAVGPDVETFVSTDWDAEMRTLGPGGEITL